MTVDQKQDLRRRWDDLKTARASWLEECRAISDVFCTRRSSALFGTKRDRPTIYDNTAVLARGWLAAGMMSGATSPARPWFKLATPDRELNAQRDVKVWLGEVQQLMERVFRASNTYAALHHSYMEHGAFGTSANIIARDYKTVVHHTPLTAGSYAIATDHRGVPNTLYREFERTVGQVVAEFGAAKCSNSVQQQFTSGQLDKPVTIIHAIEPRQDRDHRRMDGAHMPYRSTYFEAGASEGKFLRDGGFKRFRVIASRWDLLGDDVYGSGPALTALGDTKGLQALHYRKALLVDLATDPAVNAPDSLKNKQVEMRAGGTNYVPDTSKGVRPVFERPLDLSGLLEDIADTRHRIRQAMFVDLFLMLSNSPTGGERMTATEVAERHEEKLLMLGPVLERLHQEALSPLIEHTFEAMIEADLVPPPPDAMQGAQLNVEFVSMLAQAQRAVGANSTDRFVGNLGVIEALKPGTKDKFDADKWVDLYSDQIGVDPELIVANDKVALIRDERAKQQQQAQAMAQAQAQADTAKSLAQAPTDGRNALTDVMRGLTGYS